MLGPEVRNPARRRLPLQGIGRLFAAYSAKVAPCYSETLMSEPRVEQSVTHQLSLRDNELGLETRAVLCIGSLSDKTDWSAEEVCRQIGCSPDVASLAEQKPESLAHSLAFVTWLVELINAAGAATEHVALRREIVHGAVKLSKAIGGDQSARIPQARRGLSTGYRNGDGVEMTGDAYLRLGDVDRAFHLAILAVGDETRPETRHVKQIEAATNISRALQHIAPGRLAILASRDQERIQREIGLDIGLEMQSHIIRCETCRDVYETIPSSPTARFANTAQ